MTLALEQHDRKSHPACLKQALQRSVRIPEWWAQHSAPYYQLYKHAVLQCSGGLVLTSPPTQSRRGARCSGQRGLGSCGAPSAQVVGGPSGLFCRAPQKTYGRPSPLLFFQLNTTQDSSGAEKLFCQAPVGARGAKRRAFGEGVHWVIREHVKIPGRAVDV